MKKKRILLVTIILSAMITSCTDTSGDLNNSTPVDTSAPTVADTSNLSAAEEMNSETQITNPLYDIIEEYQNGKRHSQLKAELGRTEFKNLCSEYGTYINQLGDYITTHAFDLADGKKICDFNDYESTFSDFYNWAGNIIGFNKKVNSDCELVWQMFKSILLYHIDVMNEIYTADAEHLTTSVSEFLQYVTDESAVMNEILTGNYEENQNSSSSQSVNEYSGSYDAQLRYDKTSSGVLVFLSEDVMKRYMTAIDKNYQGTIDELFADGQVAYTHQGTKCNIIEKKLTKAKVKLLDGQYAGNTVWVIIEALREN